MHDNAPATEGDLPDTTSGFPYRGRRRLAEPLSRRVGPVRWLAVAGAAVAVVVVLVVVVSLARPDPGRAVLHPPQTPDASVTSGDAVLPPTAPGGSGSASPSGSRPASPKSSASPGAGAATTAPAAEPTQASPSASPPAPPQTVRYEAESATISQGRVETNHTGFSGSGFVDTTNVAGSFVQWSVTVPSSGSATLRFRFANGTATGRPTAIAVNGVTVQTLTFPSTGSWETWQTQTVTVTLNAGTNVVRAAGTTADGPPNLDYLEVVA